MATESLELEGTWEEVLARSADLAGRRVRVTVLHDEEIKAGRDCQSSRHEQMLRLLDEWDQTELSQEELEILEGFESFHREHPFTLRQLQDEP